MLPITATATFCATLVDEWARRGIRNAFVSPGSRSTPMLLALDNHERFDVHVFHDERSASFAALGYGNASDQPGVLLCTSGTAAAHFHAAVIEADLSAVPMIVCTADRPPELWNRGAPQTIGQTRLYGKAVRLFVQPGPASDAERSSWRPLAGDIADHAFGHRGGRPGPVHANLSFRNPLVGAPATLPEPIEPAHVAPTPQIARSKATEITKACERRDGVIVAGRGVSNPGAILALASRLGWPVLADYQSGVRGPATINHFDGLLRHTAFADKEQPSIILRFGEALASKALSQWLVRCAAAGAEVIGLHQPGRLIDPETIATAVAVEHGAAEEILGTITPNAEPSDIGDRWMAADLLARECVAKAVAAEPNSEIAVAIKAGTAVDSNGVFVAASSMPIRYLEWFDSSINRESRVLSNRGANGIDGVVATAVGAAITGAPTVCLIGDIAFLHDSASLVALGARDIDLTIVVIDNDGGGIFSFLPQADLLDETQFDRLFGTPHRTDLHVLANAHGLTTVTVDDDLSPDGIQVAIAICGDRLANVDTVKHFNEAITNSLN